MWGFDKEFADRPLNEMIGAHYMTWYVPTWGFLKIGVPKECPKPLFLTVHNKALEHPYFETPLLFPLLVLLLWCSGTRLDVEHCYTLLTLRLKTYDKYLLEWSLATIWLYLAISAEDTNMFAEFIFSFCHPNSLSHSGLIKSKEAEIKLGQMLHVYQKVKNSLT